MEDKGSGFVIDWKENYFRECSEFISDESTFSKDDQDRSEENKEKVRQWATKWRKEEVISEEEEDWVIVNQPQRKLAIQVYFIFKGVSNREIS